jgi:hypothetical protein
MSVLPLFNTQRILVCASILLANFARAQDPIPIVATTSPDFLGYDGAWSAVGIRIGSPEQYLSVLPNILDQETWVVGSAGCDGTTTCANERGGLFTANESSSFKAQGFYDLNFDAQLGNVGLGYYGFDKLSLNDEVTARDQIVAIVNSSDYWLGSLGLGVQQTRFTGSENVSPLLSSLVEQTNSIPSRSFGYTAGASYRLKGVPASLVLGGVDANRFQPNDLTFTLSQEYAPVVAINSISVSSGGSSLPGNWNTNPQTLLDSSEADLFTIDTSTPFLWLPEAVCDSFANALNLTYDETLQLYLFPQNTSAEALVAWNLTFTFAISNLPGSSNETQFTVPYDAFNLQLTYPFPNLDANFSSPPTNYFPLRKAANSTQYTIGRAFLQETYLTVDYERNSFQLSQSVFTIEAVNNVNLLSITRPFDSIWPGPPGPKELSTGAEIGIAFAILAGILLVVAAVFCCICQRRRPKHIGGEKRKRRSLFPRISRGPDSTVTVAELLGDKRHPHEVAADTSATRFELSSATAIEMPAAPVSPTFFQSEEGQPRRTITRNDPRWPAEMDPQHPIDKSAEAFATASVRSVSPVPEYSPMNYTHNPSDGISPNSGRNSRAFGRLSSEGPKVSPVGGSHPSSNGNRSTPSPISPDIANRPRDFADSDPNSPQTSTGRNSLAVPMWNGRPPSRSPSTGSRFVEEGLAQEAGPSAAPQAAGRPKAHRARFSFE